MSHRSLLLLALCACTGSGRQAATDSAASSGAESITARASADSARQAQAAASTPASQAPDTLVGQVSEVGADPATYLAIVPRPGRELRLEGKIDEFRSILGAQVWVSGFTNGGFNVEAFEVRAVNGQPVDDGVVVVEPNGVAIRTRSGTTRPVPNAPPALRALSGKRVWVTRPAANQAPSYGEIAVRR